jgi:tetratricopeptide (TPR) repeat protein
MCVAGRVAIRQRGNSLQVRLFSGVDPVTGRDVYLTATIKGTDKAARKAADDKLAEFRTQVVKQRSAQSSVGRAFVLADAGEASSAVSVLAEVRRAMDSKVSRLLRAWLAAAHGETLAANGDRNGSLRAFDKAAELLPSDSTDPEGPYVALDQVHLARWRGNALAQFADPDAVGVVSGALDRLDPTFIRAETGLRVDLATALAALDEQAEARAQAKRAEQLAERIGSARQRRRMRLLAATIS